MTHCSGEYEFRVDGKQSLSLAAMLSAVEVIVEKKTDPPKIFLAKSSVTNHELQIQFQSVDQSDQPIINWSQQSWLIMEKCLFFNIFRLELCQADMF